MHSHENEPYLKLRHRHKYGRCSGGTLGWRKQSGNGPAKNLIVTKEHLEVTNFRIVKHLSHLHILYLGTNIMH